MPDFRQKTHVGLASGQCMGLIVGATVVTWDGEPEFRIVKFHRMKRYFAVLKRLHKTCQLQKFYIRLHRSVLI